MRRFVEYTRYSDHYSDESFWEKVRHFASKAGGDVIQKALVLHYCLRDPCTPNWARGVIAGALGYFILPADAIPDLTPVVGLVDDLGALTAALGMVGLPVKPEHKRFQSPEGGSWRIDMNPEGKGERSAQRAASRASRFIDAVIASDGALETSEQAWAVVGNQFRKTGEYWTIAYDGKAFRLRDTKGLRYIAHLLGSPGRDFHVADLVANGSGRDLGLARLGPPGTRKAACYEYRHMAPEGDAGPILDARARAECKRRLYDLRAEIEEATRSGDLGRMHAAQGESDVLRHELAAAYGLGGRARTACDPTERMRKAVSNRIRASLIKIRREHPALSQHLANSLRTGIFCSYTPDRAIAWEV